jgi:glycosyltransferase involved in cell wall biosynthesis
MNVFKTEPAAAALPQRRTVAIVMPVYNDAASFFMLIEELDAIAATVDVCVTVLAVDDSSMQELDLAHPSFARVSSIAAIEVIRLAANVGHQRAIAVGLTLAAEQEAIDRVIVMDSDGEDRPADIPRLLEASQANPGAIVCAERRERSEGGLFRVAYAVYKLLFRCLTGVTIRFGNFCLIPRDALRSLTYNAGIWNHLAATVIRSRLAFVGIGVARGRRYAGQSQMNLVSLIVHGLSAVSLFSETVLVRILLLMLGLTISTTAAIFVVVAIRLFYTDAAIPGWASTVGGTLLTILLQALLTCVVMAFFILNGRSSPAVLPALESHKFVLSRKLVRLMHD